jgi:hypothetical protein
MFCVDDDIRFGIPFLSVPEPNMCFHLSDYSHCFACFGNAKHENNPGGEIIEIYGGDAIRVCCAANPGSAISFLGQIAQVKHRLTV